MSALAKTVYEIRCDWPGCNHRDDDCGAYEIFCWDTPEEAASQAEESDWWMGRDGKTHYCRCSHPATWASDHEEGEPFPEPPYLLIHDGDTDNPLDDDGKVSLIGAKA